LSAASIVVIVVVNWSYFADSPVFRDDTSAIEMEL